MKSPALVLLDSSRLKDAFQTDPALLALLEQGYTVTGFQVVEDGPPEALQQRLGVFLAPPSQRPAVLARDWPRWASWGLGAVVAFQAVLVALLAVLVARG